MIREIIDDQRQMVREVITEGLAQGRNPTVLASDLVGSVNSTTGAREGGVIGLTSSQAKWVRNARDDLERLDTAYFERKLRDKRFDATVRRAIREGRPLSRTDIRKITRRYEARLLKARADTIARTEGITALRAGRHEGYQQLVDTGAVSERQIVRTWDATGDARTRRDHMLMEGQQITGLSAAFVAPDGSRLMYPGDTSMGASAAQVIKCRCFEQIRIKRI